MMSEGRPVPYYLRQRLLVAIDQALAEDQCLPSPTELARQAGVSATMASLALTRWWSERSHGRSAPRPDGGVRPE
jgi:hypothetical protein